MILELEQTDQESLECQKEGSTLKSYDCDEDNKEEEKTKEDVASFVTVDINRDREDNNEIKTEEVNVDQGQIGNNVDQGQIGNMDDTKHDQKKFVVSLNPNSNGKFVCRICLIDSKRAQLRDFVMLGCGCKKDLGYSHRKCAKTLFNQKDNRICKICGMTAKNIRINPPEKAEYMKLVNWSHLSLENRLEFAHKQYAPNPWTENCTFCKRHACIFRILISLFGILLLHLFLKR
ncbi:uncharacterized protein LOC124942778 [Impatiens glandulifera]|uniref:uncharacterized protein LOC124942778 n=1 Tax=Impatiens glandulifera TaxID=253017 RepID=UPI001FB0B384|nr:uncharacterized protein LOC124942778 [Impatiens glandulifera]